MRAVLIGVSWLSTLAAGAAEGGVLAPMRWNLNLGLNRATPGVQAYIGVSHRF